MAPGGRWSLIGGLPLVNINCPTPSPLLIPSILVKGVDGSAFQDLQGLAWDYQVGSAKVGFFPVDGRLSFLLPGWERITSDQYVLEGVRQRYSLPFVRSLPLALTSVETPLPRLQFKQEICGKRFNPS